MENDANKAEFPMRINKYLAMKGYATRRSADDLIKKKAVMINGRFAVLGDKVNLDDVVEVSKNKKRENYIYYAYNKPVGMTTNGTKKGDKDIMSSIPLKGVFPVGNLDKNASGLIILTNDRRIIDRLENPKHTHPRRYVVETREPLRQNFKEKVEAGISIEGGPKINSQVEILTPTSFAITLSEAGNPIRTIVSLFRSEIESMNRTDILNIRLGKLAPNSSRLISGEELSVFMKSLGL